MPKIANLLFLDIDGTVRKGYSELGKYVHKKEEVELFPDMKEILIRYKENGWRIAGISNQGGIAMGWANVQEVQGGMEETNRQAGGVFDKIYMCVHHPDSPQPESRICKCRKPQIGLLLQAIQEFSEKYDETYPTANMLFVGDRPEDKACAKNAGIAFVDAKQWREGLSNFIRTNKT